MTSLNQPNNFFYLKAFVVICVATVCDLLFDYAFEFNGDTIISFIFTVITALVVFTVTGRLYFSKDYENVNEFIKSNFDRAQVILSILDVICGIISILFGAYIICIKILKVIYVPTKLLILLNKGKTIAQFSRYWVAARLFNKITGEQKMGIKEYLSSNKWYLFWGILSGLLGACGTFYFTYVNFNTLWIEIAAPIVAFFVFFFMTKFVGYDTLKGLELRYAHKVLSEDKYNELVEIYEAFETSAKQKQLEEEEAKRATLVKLAKAIESGEYKIENLEKIVNNQTTEEVVYVPKNN